MTKKTLFFLSLFLLLFVGTAQAQYYPTVTKTYTYSQFKAAARYLADRGGLKLHFLNKNVSGLKCSTQVLHKNQRPYACKMLYYDTKWYSNPTYYGNPDLNRQTYRYMAIQFLASFHFIVSPKNKNTFYVYSMSGTNKNILKYMQYVENSKSPYQNDKVLFGHTGLSAYVIPYTRLMSFINYKYYDPVTQMGVPGLNAGKIQNQEVAQYKNLALAKLNKIAGGIGTNKTYGITPFGLETLVFNISDPNYYKESEGTIAQILQLGSVNGFLPQQVIGGRMANMASLASHITQLSTINDSVNATLNSIVSKLNAMSFNHQALYGNVDGYYANALTAKYGTLKTNFLKEMGIGANIDISYNTILMNSNLFLDRINSNPAALIRFEKLFGVKFNKKWNMRQNYIPTSSVEHIEGTFATVAASSGGLYTLTPLNYTAMSNISKLADYPVISSSSVNFYSFIYYLLNDIYFKTGFRKRTAEKLFRYLVFNQYDKALKVFYSIPAQAVLTKNENKIEQAVYYINAGNLEKAKHIIETYGTISSLRAYDSRLNNGNSKYARQMLIFRYLEILYLAKKYQRIKATPWAGASKKAILKTLNKLKRNSFY